MKAKEDMKDNMYKFENCVDAQKFWNMTEKDSSKCVLGTVLAIVGVLCFGAKQGIRHWFKRKQSTYNSSQYTENDHNGANKESKDELSNDAQNNTWNFRSYSEMESKSSVAKELIKGYAAVGQITFEVAGASIGKTILLSQIANSVARGLPMAFLPIEDQNPIQMSVVYYRMEEYSGEFRGKYGEGKFLIDSGIMWKTKSDLVSFTLQGLINDLNSLAETVCEDTLICIDPITKLPDFNAEKFIAGAENAQNISAKRNVILTFIVSAHVDELKDWLPLTSVNIKGGDKLIQQAGAVFALRRERSGIEYRFLQVLKAPKGCQDRDKVTVCKIVEEKIDELNKNTFMVYQCDKDKDYALPAPPKSKPNDSKTNDTVENDYQKRFQAKKLYESGVKVRDIANQYNVERQTIYNWMKWAETHLDYNNEER